MSLVSLCWDKEYSTSGKIPAEWEIPYTEDLFGVGGTNRMYANFSPQAISYRIKDMFLFPVRKPYRRIRIKITTNQYFDIGYNLFI